MIRKPLEDNYVCSIGGEIWKLSKNQRIEDIYNNVYGMDKRIAYEIKVKIEENNKKK